MHNLANDAVYSKMIGSYSEQLKEWMRQQNDAGAVVDKEFQAPKKDN